MVAWNLRGLADLVPFLGASVVVGGDRVRYFVEGRPKVRFRYFNSVGISFQMIKQVKKQKTDGDGGKLQF